MKKYLLLFLTITMIIAITTKVKAQVNTQDSLALVDLYNSTGGINWSNNTNWLTIAPVSSWYGVTVSSGRVTKINFNLNQLTGSIPTSIGNLSKLTALILRFEQLSGSIPSSLGNLRNLISLDLGNNQLSGVIPSFLGNLTSLQSLSLSGNQFSSGSIPSSFANLTNLTSLVLVGDSLTGSIPSFLGNLTNLNNPNSYLELSGNQLSGSIPSSLGNLTNIRYLWLANNQLSGAIPSSFENHVSDLPGIQFNLWLSGNQFTFAGMEGLSKFSAVQYAPQATIPLNANNNVLSVSAGGTPSNNTYKWYEDSVLIATKVGDSTYTITSSGRYFVNVTNSVATQLTLASTTFITPPTLTSFTPTIAMTGTTDTIRGSGFTGATAVSFGGVAAKYFTILNDSTITAVVNNGASGDINITTAGGTGSLAGFIYCVPNSSITNANICYKGTYIFNNKSYTTAGIYKATLTNSLECDSIATLVLTVGNAPVTKITNYHSCQSFIYNGITYQNSTTVIDTIKNYQGCDSIYNVANININPIVPTSNYIPLNSCNQLTYAGKTYYQSTVATDTTKSYQGCDSIYNVLLITINKILPVTNISYLSSCNSLYFNGKIYTGSTNVIDTIRSYQGCDSIYNVTKISINKIIPKSTSNSITGCNSVAYKGNTYFSTSFVKDTIRSYQGCDSIYNTTLIVINKITPVTQSTNLSGCSSVIYNSKEYFSSDVIHDTIRSYQGCDSIYKVVTITVTPIVAVAKSIQYSGCNSVVYHGKTYTVSTIVKDTVRSYQGCDSIYNTATITITPITPVIKPVQFSGCNSVVYHGKTYTSSTIIKDTIRSYQGCDSIYDVATITIKPITPFTKSIKYSGCNSVVYNGKTYTISTVIRDTVRSYQGCDSIYNLTTITITPITPVIKPVEYSGCNSVVYHGKTYTATTIVKDTISSYQGCDSIYDVATISIKSITPATKSLKYIGCNSVTYNGTTYTSSTIVKDTVRSYQGCDSIYNVATITITPITPLTKSIKYTGCNSVVYNGKSYTTTTILRDTVRSYQGCDSIYNVVTITITPITPLTKSIKYSGCNSVVYNGTTFTASTIVRDTVKSYQGCDSIYNIATITVNPLPAVSINGNTTLKNDTTLLTAIVNNANNSGLVRYIKYTSTYSDDNGQVDVYEIQAYKNGVNLALNKSGYANSYGPGGGTWNNNGYMVDDGVNGTRWSSDRRNPGHASTTTPIYIQIDLQQVYSIDSILLNIAGFDNHKETFTMQVSTDTINWTTIGAATDTTGTFIYSLASNSVLWSTGSTNQSIIVDSAGIYSVKVTDINGCSNTAFDTIRKVLPVTISSFTATDHNKTIETEWQTATELNTSHFIIQHRTDGTSFAEIGNVKAVGSGANKYQFEDSKPNTGINYYRLESVDMDGTTTYSKVVSVEYANAVNHLTIYPNPVKNILTISGEHITRVQILDNMGRIVNTQFLHDAINPSLSVSNLPIGIYHVRIQTTDNKTNTIGFVKQ